MDDAAQSARMNRLISMAIDQAIKLGTPAAPFPDDNAFLIVRAAPARGSIDGAELDGDARAAQASEEQRLGGHRDREVVATAGRRRAAAECHVPPAAPAC